MKRYYKRRGKRKKIKTTNIKFDGIRIASKLFCGIDQGLSGAIAFLDEDGDMEIHDMPTLTIGSGRKSPKTGKEGKKKVLDWPTILGLFEDHEPAFTVVEQLQITGKPGEFKQSVQSVATTHRNGGIIVGMLMMGKLAFEEVRAAQWQKEFFKKSRKGLDTKVQSYEAACRLLPEQVLHFKGPRGGIKDGRTDAALMALHARRMHYGKGKT